MAVQMYTLREECAKDFIGTLEQVAALGFQGVEFAGYFGLSARELKGHLARLGLEAVGTHTSFQDMFEKTKEVIDFHLELGCSNIVLPYYPIKSSADVAELTEKMEAVLGEYAKHGLQLCYHNHDFELQSDGGERYLDQIAKVGGLGLELDLFWVHTAGVRPAEYIIQHRDRLQLVHLKDGKDRKPSAIGEGEVDFAPIFDTLRELDLEWAILENDHPRPDGIADITRSRDYLVGRYSDFVSFGS